MINSSSSNKMIRIGNLDLGHLIDTLNYLATPTPKSSRFLITLGFGDFHSWSGLPGQDLGTVGTGDSDLGTVGMGDSDLDLGLTIQSVECHKF